MKPGAAILKEYLHSVCRSSCLVYRWSKWMIHVLHYLSSFWGMSSHALATAYWLLLPLSHDPFILSPATALLFCFDVTGQDHFFFMQFNLWFQLGAPDEWEQGWSLKSFTDFRGTPGYAWWFSIFHYWSLDAMSRGSVLLMQDNQQKIMRFCFRLLTNERKLLYMWRVVY